MIAGTLAVFVAIAASACTWRIGRYRSWSRLPSRRADCFRFSGHHLAIDVRIEPDGIPLPRGLDLRGRTVLLQTTIQASPLGHLIDPCIEIQDGQRIHCQYFERGAAGQRYLNLSPLFQHGSSGPFLRVGLRGKSIQWKPEGVLLAFDPPPIDAATIMVLSPHPDDAELAGFGMYAHRQSWVTTITAGEKATANLPNGIPSYARARWAASLRVWDSLSIPQLGQVTPDRCVNLVYPDGALESMYREPAHSHRLACEDSLPRSALRSRNEMPAFQRDEIGCTWHHLIEEIRLLLGLTHPDIVVCPHPLLDTHPDHVFTTVALERAMHDLPGKRPILFLYVVHGRGGSLFPYGPATALASLPPGSVDGYVADSIYSHPLDSATRQAKHFAVEAAHAVRDYAAGESTPFLNTVKSIRKEIVSYLGGVGLQPASHLRRAPRPNEMYYVVCAETLTGMVDSMTGLHEPSVEHVS
jgi:LmbE family N-acetylglucosaminyl deacetylase